MSLSRLLARACRRHRPIPAFLPRHARPRRLLARFARLLRGRLGATRRPGSPATPTTLAENVLEAVRDCDATRRKLHGRVHDLTYALFNPPPSCALAMERGIHAAINRYSCRGFGATTGFCEEFQRLPPDAKNLIRWRLVDLERNGLPFGPKSPVFRLLKLTHAMGRSIVALPLPEDWLVVFLMERNRAVALTACRVLPIVEQPLDPFGRYRALGFDTDPRRSHFLFDNDRPVAIRVTDADIRRAPRSSVDPVTIEILPRDELFGEYPNARGWRKRFADTESAVRFLGWALGCDRTPAEWNCVFRHMPQIPPPESQLDLEFLYLQSTPR